MNLINKRAIKIVQLQEELEEAKQIITEFVWPGDGTKESHQRFQQKAARFAGCTVPIFDGQPERPNSLENIQSPTGNDSQQGKGGEGEMKTKELKEVDEVKNEIKRREAVAQVWREIGQPDTKGIAFLCEPGGKYDLGKEIIGIPLFKGSLHGSDVPLMIIGYPETDGELVDSINGRFERAGRCIL
jgi:hypothetical protein